MNITANGMYASHVYLSDNLPGSFLIKEQLVCTEYNVLKPLYYITFIHNYDTI